jgi:hypothetical protein
VSGSGLDTLATTSPLGRLLDLFSRRRTGCAWRRGSVRGCAVWISGIRYELEVVYDVQKTRYEAWLAAAGCGRERLRERA